MTVEELYAAYVAERPRFLRLARRVCRLLEDRVLAEGVGGVAFEFRAKEALSYVRKALVKGYGDPLREATDLAGVRATCLYLTTCERVESIIKREFIVVDTGGFEPENPTGMDTAANISLSTFAAAEPPATVVENASARFRSGRGERMLGPGSRTRRCIREM